MRISTALILSLSLCVGSMSIHAEAININHANVAELAGNLQQVGMVKAQAIIDYREEHGEYLEVEQLLEVQGIGVSTLELNKHLIILELDEE